MIDNYFLNMIKHLREQEEIMLYGNLLEVSELDAIETTEFLRNEYGRETLSFPFTAPVFDENAALWAAKTVYVSAQLMLYRENKSKDLALLLPACTTDMSPSAILSADLCLRFIPDILVQLKWIDADDRLIPVLEDVLRTWHFSGVSYPLHTEQLDLDMLADNNCLQQLYVNRIIEYKKINLAKHPVLVNVINANLGIFAPTFWNDFKTEIISDGTN